MKKLEINYLDLLKASTKDRQQVVQSTLGKELLEALTPSQQAALFPSSYLKNTPTASSSSGGSAAMSGGTSLGSSGGGSSSTSSYSYASPSSGSSSTPSSDKEQPTQKPWRERMADLKKSREAAATTKATAGTGRRIDRSRFADQMKDPETLAMFAARMKSEVGSQGREAKIAWAETTFNRAEARKLTLKQAVSGKYFPTSNPGRSDDQDLIGIIREVQENGTDTTNGATGNASGNVGFGYGKAKRDANGNWHAPGQTAAFGGERFGRERNDEKWQPTYLEDLDAAKVAEAQANPTAVIPQDNQTGNVQPKQDAASVGPPPAPKLTDLPQGIDPGIVEYYRGLSPDDQQKFLGELSGVPVATANEMFNDDKKKSQVAKQALAGKSLTYAAGLQPKFKLPDGKTLTDALPADTERFFHAGGKLEGVDPKLLHLLKESSKDLPAGYRMEMISGKDARSTGTKNHPNGLAVDVKLYDDKGKALNHGSPGAGWGAYERMYQSVYQRGKMYYPDEEFIWGGAWHSAAAGMGDKMHYQRRVRGVGSQGMGGYDPDKGLPREKHYLDPTGEHLTPEQIQDHRNWVKARVEAQAEQRAREEAAKAEAKANPMAVIPEDNQSGNVQPKQDVTSVGPPPAPEPTIVDQAVVAKDAQSTPNGASVENSSQPPQPEPSAETPSSQVEPQQETPAAAIQQRMSQEQLYSKFSPEEREELKNLDTKRDTMAGVKWWQNKAQKYDPATPTAKPVDKAPQKAPEAPAKVSEAPKDDKPKMASGGRVRASGEDFSIVDNESKRKLGEIRRGENVHFKDNGGVQVTPDRRINPRDLERAREVRNDASDKASDQRTKQNETMTKPATNVPDGRTAFASKEIYDTAIPPASYTRAMAAAKGRKDTGAFAGSRFGEEQLSNLS